MLADFGEFALRSNQLDAVLTKACQLVADAMATGHAKVLEIEAGTGTLLVRAGIGWDDGIVGTLRLKLADHSSESHAVAVGVPVICNDLAGEGRFEVCAIAKEAGVRALANVPIFLSGGRAFGLLQVDALEPRAFDDDDSQFLRTYAMILGPVIDRLITVRALEASEQQFRRLLDAMPQMVWRSTGQGRWTWSSRQWQAVTGQTPAKSLGLGWLLAIHPDDREPARLAWAAASADGLVDVEHRVRRDHDGAYLWHRSRSVPVRDESDQIIEWLGTTTDVDEMKALQDDQAVLVAELQHRTRNLLGVVRAMIEKSVRASSGLADFRTRFSDRLDALARVQGLLSRLSGVERINFDELLNSELSALGGRAGQVTLDGPPGVRLRSSTVQALALALHELGTNALTYGALAQPDGRLAIHWWVKPGDADNKPWLYVDWQESGVQMPAPDSRSDRSGQGRDLIERALPYQLAAQTSFEMGNNGVRCQIALPISNSKAHAT